ncbi:NAD(P)H-binding protein [Sorangium sp. So ce1000]|uniref:NAD(P)H-binding protein n=1 Tax=Sorangium sp. So ce1000 TaxID=3133325 RepID=UPI003F5E464D
MILVAGATGTIGRALVPQLLAARADVRVLTRDPARARALWGSDVEVACGDFTDAPSLGRALEGVDRVFLNTAPGPTVAEHDSAMAAAVMRSRVEQIVKLSAYGAEQKELTASGWHRAGEEAVIATGRRFTLLRPAGFHSNVLGWAASVRAGAAIEISTGRGKHAVVDPRDIAAVAARALTSGDHDGRAYTLTGPVGLDAHEQVALLAEALGRPIATQDVTVEHATAKMRAAGAPEAFVAAVLEGLTFLRDGRAGAPTGDVAAILGRPPRSFAAWVRDHLDAFR